MGESLITMTAIFLAAILMFIFPLLTVSERTDDVAQLAVQTATAEFVDDVRSKGKLTDTRYNAFIQTLAATGNTYTVELEFKILDDNPGKKAAWTSTSKIGENVYYSIFNSQILENLDTSDVYKLKEGDIVSVNVKNTNTTLSQMLRNFFYTMSGKDTYQVAAQHAGIVTANGEM